MEKQSKKPFYLSLGLHVFMLIAGMIAMPFLSQPRTITAPPPITVTFVEAEKKQTTENNNTEKKKEVKKQVMPKALVQPTPVNISKPTLPNLEKTEILPKPSPKSSKKPVPPKEEKPEKPAKLPTEKKDFMSVLKNLADEEVGDVKENDTKADEGSDDPQPVSESLNMGELRALREQLAQCWNIPPGARNAQDLVIELKLKLSPSREILKASLIDNGRYHKDSFYRAAADSALRAVRSPQCTPLKLPANKYDQWRDLVLRFDPKDMF